MELLFRKYFWVINLAFLLLAAFLSAKTVNVLIGGKMTPLPDLTPAPAASPAAPRAPHKPRLSAEALSAATGIELPEPEPEVVEPGAIGEDEGGGEPLEDQDPVKTGLRVKLIGTMVAINHPQWSMASIQDVAANDTTVYMLGDRIQNAEIVGIERLRVLINNNGRLEYIDQEPGDGSTPLPQAAAPAPHPAVASRASSSDIGSGIRAINENTYEVPKEEITRALNNLNDIAMQARIVPAFKDGVATGFKLFSIRPNSLYSKIGVQNGDVIRRINGFEINSPDKALEVYTKLKESSRIEIEIERSGQTMRKTYNVR